MIAFGLVLATIASASPNGAECVATDDRGNTFPTCFDPGEGFELGAGVASRVTEAKGSGTTLELRGGILVRSERESGSRPGSLWFDEERMLMTRVQPANPLRELTSTFLEGTWRRHLEESFILLPGSPPLRLPFPFDVALHTRLATLDRRVFDGPGYTLEVGRLALMLDPARSVSGRYRAAFGPAISYTVRNDGDRFTHELSPFASAVVDLGAESADGWWNARLYGIAGWVSTTGGGTSFRASGQLDLERLLFAINDAPIWLYVSARAAKDDAGVRRATELVGSAGLVMRAFQ